MILVIVRHHYSSWLLPDFAQSKRACSSWPLLLDHISTDLNSSKLKFPIYYKLQQNSFSNLLPFPQSYYSNRTFVVAVKRVLWLSGILRWRMMRIEEWECFQGHPLCPKWPSMSAYWVLLHDNASSCNPSCHMGELLYIWNCSYYNHLDWCSCHWTSMLPVILSQGLCF